MAREDLIPVTKGSERARMLGRKGGSSKGKNKAQAAKWRHVKRRLKEACSTNEDAKWMLEKLENRDAWSADIAMYIHKLQKEGVHPSQRIALGHLMTQAAKFHHGDKVKVESQNVNINIDVELEEAREHLKKMFESN